MKNLVEVIVCDRNGRIKSRSRNFNLRTNAGADWVFNQLFSSSPSGIALYAAVTADAAAPLATDTVLANEQTANGLNRTLMVAPHNAGSAFTVLAGLYTYTGSTVLTLSKAGLFTAQFGGVMLCETLLTPPQIVENPGDQVLLNWTVNF